MSGFCHHGRFPLKPGARKAFRSCIDDNASRPAAMSRLPPLRRHRAAKARADRILLYEIYDDRAAFDAHIKTPHFLAFDEASAPLVADKTVSDLRSRLRRLGLTSGD